MEHKSNSKPSIRHTFIQPDRARAKPVEEDEKGARWNQQPLSWPEPATPRRKSHFSQRKKGFDVENRQIDCKRCIVTNQ